MMIQQIEHKYSEEHIMESTTVNKKNTARTICAIIGGIIVLNLLWWIGNHSIFRLDTHVP